MRKRDEDRLRKKLQIPDDYELCTIRLDFIRHKRTKSDTGEDLLKIAREANRDDCGLTLCHATFDYPSAERGVAGARDSFGFDISDAMYKIEQGPFPVEDETIAWADLRFTDVKGRD